MFIRSFNIKNFKSFKDLTIEFNPDLNILTGINNSGKTTVLEAISLWHECFTKIIRKAGRSTKVYKKGDWVLGNSYVDEHSSFKQLNSVRSPNFEDIFHRKDKRNKIELSATLSGSAEETIEIRFKIGGSGSNYIIELDKSTSYDFAKFNNFFSSLPAPFQLFYASPVAAIEPKEDFVTDPQINDALLTRKSSSVIRNRLYKLYQTSRFPQFLSDLSFILYNKTSPELIIGNESDIQKDTRVSISFEIGNNDISKDISLLGSGSLQTIEILLNVYQQSNENKDLNIILLDEPDSHIHRDIQKRLIEVLTKFSKNNQIFLSTHNEAMIRSASYNHLFHLDGKPEAKIKSFSKANIEKQAQAHFKGIYPSQINPVIRSIGETTGLDFINAIECDRLIFVEGEDDARIINRLLQENISNVNRKFMFWVLGGISKIFDDINSYKKVFSQIKNAATLWEKSALIFDKDDLSNEHKTVFTNQLTQKLGIPAYCYNAYTLEATIFTDLVKSGGLINLWIQQKTSSLADQDKLNTSLVSEYLAVKQVLEARFNDKFYEEVYFRYKNHIEKAEELFGERLIRLSAPQLMNYIRQYHASCLLSGDFFKLMKKEDVEMVIIKVVQAYGLTFSIETDFYDLIKLVNKSLWINEWNFLNQI